MSKIQKHVPFAWQARALTRRLALGAFAARLALPEDRRPSLADTFAGGRSVEELFPGFSQAQALPGVRLPFGLTVVAGPRGTYKSSLLQAWARATGAPYVESSEPTATNPLIPGTTIAGLDLLLDGILAADLEALKGPSGGSASAEAVEAVAERDAPPEVVADGEAPVVIPDGAGPEAPDAGTTLEAAYRDREAFRRLMAGDLPARGGVAYYDGLTSLFFEISENLGRGGVSKALKSALQEVHNVCLAAQINVVASFNTMGLTPEDDELLHRIITSGLWSTIFVTPSNRSALAASYDPGYDLGPDVRLNFDIRPSWRGANAFTRIFTFPKR